MLSELRLLAALPALATLGCATIVNGPTQDVEITSNPPGASVLILPEKKMVVTPAEVELDRKTVHTLIFELEGCRPATGYLDRLNSNVTTGNVILGGLIGIAIDYDSGAVYRLDPDPLHVVLQPAKEPLQSTATQAATPRCVHAESSEPD